MYAVGEIVLVVIGILIALAIDTALENRTIREQERAYLTELREEFSVSRRKLEELIRVNRQSAAGATLLVDYTASKQDRPDERELAELLYGTFASDVVFNPNNALLTEIINSGKLQVLSQPRLRLRLTDWLATLEDIAKQEAELFARRGAVVDMVAREPYSIRTILRAANGGGESGKQSDGMATDSNLALLESREFENLLLLFLTTCEATDRNHYVPLLQDLDEILRLLGGQP